MLPMLCATPGVEVVRRLDVRPPRARAGVQFVKHRLGSDSAESLRAALEGIECVMSVVTPDIETATAEDMDAVNHRGVVSLLQQSAAAGVRAFVYASSIAATCQSIPSHNWSEAHPLPPLESYTSAYDVSKRKGEEAVLNANTRGGLATVAVRAGGILSSPRDYCFRQFLKRPGRIFLLSGCAPIDMIHGADFSRALCIAAGRLCGEEGGEQGAAGVAGKVFFATKGRGDVLTPYQIGVLTAAKMGWQVIVLPKILELFIRGAFRVATSLRRLFGGKAPACPPADYMRLPLIEKTFDNTKAQQVLGFEPRMSVLDAVQSICEDWMAEQRATGTTRNHGD